jgi:Skp family chaperone for outer membrane proteins
LLLFFGAAVSVPKNHFEAIHLYRSIAIGMGLFALGLPVGWVLFGRPKGPQVVYVRTNEVMSRYKGAIQVRDTFQKETSAWAEEARQLERKLQELVKTGKFTDPKVKEQANQLRSRMDSLRQKGAQRDQELTAPMLAEVNAGIKKFAKKHGYALVLGTMNGGVVLHGDESVDVTEALVAELNR